MDYITKFAKHAHEVAGNYAADVCGKKICNAGKLVCTANLIQPRCRACFEIHKGLKDEFAKEFEN